MMRSMQELFQQFESQGEAHVRENIVAGRYGGFKRQCAVEWLTRFDRARVDASHSEEIEIARSAKDAAWEAAAAAHQANTIAKIAALSAVVAVVAAVLSLFG